MNMPVERGDMVVTTTRKCHVSPQMVFQLSLWIFTNQELLYFSILGRNEVTYQPFLRGFIYLYCFLLCYTPNPWLLTQWFRKTAASQRTPYLFSFHIYLCVLYVCVCMCVRMHACAKHAHGGQKASHRSWLFPPAVVFSESWVPSAPLQSSCGELGLPQWRSRESTVSIWESSF